MVAVAEAVVAVAEAVVAGNGAEEEDGGGRN